MAVFKWLRCKDNDCRNKVRATREERSAPPCPKCGGERAYSKKWHASVYVMTTDGEKKETVRAVSTKKADAELQEGRTIVHRADGGRVAATNPLMNDALDDFIDYLQDEVLDGRLAESTKVYYEKRTKLLRPLWKKMKLADWAAQAEDLVDTYKRKRRQQVKPATLNRELATLKRFCSWAKEKKRLPVNPLQGYKLLVENNQRDRVLTQEEMKALLDECGKARNAERLKLAVIIALETGLRREGVLTLKWSEVDWIRNEIVKVVKHHRSQGPKEVRIPLTPKLRDELLAWHKELKKEKVAGLGGYVLPSPRKPETHMKVTSDFGFANACIRAGIDVIEEWNEKKGKEEKKTGFHFHDLRHTFATYFLMRTKNLHALAEILGHSPAEEYRMSRRYAHILSDEKHRAMKQFAEGDE